MSGVASVIVVAFARRFALSTSIGRGFRLSLRVILGLGLVFSFRFPFMINKKCLNRADLSLIHLVRFFKKWEI